jgi:hypothetical protein
VTSGTARSLVLACNKRNIYQSNPECWPVKSRRLGGPLGRVDAATLDSSEPSPICSRTSSRLPGNAHADHDDSDDADVEPSGTDTRVSSRGAVAIPGLEAWRRQQSLLARSRLSFSSKVSASHLEGISHRCYFRHAARQRRAENANPGMRTQTINAHSVSVITFLINPIGDENRSGLNRQEDIEGGAPS